MRRKIPAVLTAALLLSLLTACGRRDGETALDGLREELSRSSRTAISADVTADSGESAQLYSLDMVSADGAATVTVTAPEEIAGISARVADGGATLEYDGVILRADALAANGLSPVTALPMLLDAIERGFVDGAWSEGGGFAVKLVTDDEMTVTLRLSEDGRPEYAEFISAESGRVLVSCEITDFSLS